MRFWAAGFAVVLLTSCQQVTSGHPSAVSPSATPASTVSARDLEGSWSGQTSQGRPITFTITGGVITQITIEGRYGGDSCNTTTKYSASGTFAIDGATFHKSSYGSGRTVIDGTFTSSTSATGGASFTPTDTSRSNGCVSIGVTWQASKTS